MPTDAYRRLYERWLLELWHGDLALADEIVTPGFLVHQARADGADSEARRGPAFVRDMVREARAPFRDLTFSIAVGPFGDGDLLGAHWRALGAYAGGMPGVTATPGTEVSFGGIDILRLEGDRFAEYWVCSDGLRLMAQLGLV
jgi:hypothetical protein